MICLFVAVGPLVVLRFIVLVKFVDVVPELILVFVHSFLWKVFLVNPMQ